MWLGLDGCSFCGILCLFAIRTGDAVWSAPLQACAEHSAQLGSDSHGCSRGRCCCCIWRGPLLRYARTDHTLFSRLFNLNIVNFSVIVFST
uniref:Secreted protein n=1 Tax=Rhipicephalus zambeziensis TaxID=60191 RepID=A0A224YAN0_9ACAR